MRTTRVCNTVERSRVLYGGRLVLKAHHNEFRLVDVSDLVGIPDVVLISEYCWVRDSEGRQRKQLQYHRLVDTDMGLTEWEHETDRRRRNISVWYEENAPLPELPEGLHRGASWNERCPFVPVNLREVLAYATA